MIWRNTLSLCTAGLLLAACGGVDEAGNVTGPLGQKPLMTDAVRTAVAAGLDACATASANAAPVSGLEAQGFARTRNGYSAKIANPNVLGSSSVRVTNKREGCEVFVSPVYPAEKVTVRRLVAERPGAPLLRVGTISGVGFVSATYEH